jgi:hypothetical protein
MGTNEIRKDPCEDIRRERESYDKITATKNRGIFFCNGRQFLVVVLWHRRNSLPSPSKNGFLVMPVITLIECKNYYDSQSTMDNMIIRRQTRAQERTKERWH